MIMRRKMTMRTTRYRILLSWEFILTILQPEDIEAQYAKELAAEQGGRRYFYSLFVEWNELTRDSYEAYVRDELEALKENEEQAEISDTEENYEKYSDIEEYFEAKKNKSKTEGRDEEVVKALSKRKKTKKQLREEKEKEEEQVLEDMSVDTLPSRFRRKYQSALFFNVKKNIDVPQN